MPEPAICGQCDSIIDDSTSTSIRCDICHDWVHADEKCSKLKKTIFRYIKNIDWVCPTCIDFGKKCRSKNKNDLQAGLIKLQEEIKQVRNMNFILFEENKTYLAKIETLRRINSGLKKSLKHKNQNDKNTSNISNSKLELSLNTSKNLSNSNLSINDTLERVTKPTVNKATQTAPHNNKAASSEININRNKQGLKTKCSLTGQQMTTSDLVSGKKQIQIYSDSHGRGLQNLVHNKCGADTPVTVNFCPGAPMQYYVTQLTDKTNLDPNTIQIVMGGVNDTRDMTVNASIDFLEKNSSKLNQIAIVETPYRYDRLHLNKYIKKQNDRLKEICQKHNWKFIPINFALFRLHYTRAGLHLNFQGKNVVSTLISHTILEYFLKNKTPSAPSPKKPDQDENTPIHTTPNTEQTQRNSPQINEGNNKKNSNLKNQSQKT